MNQRKNSYQISKDDDIHPILTKFFYLSYSLLVHKITGTEKHQKKCQ